MAEQFSKYGTETISEDLQGQKYAHSVTVLCSFSQEYILEFSRGYMTSDIQIHCMQKQMRIQWSSVKSDIKDMCKTKDTLLIVFVLDLYSYISHIVVFHENISCV